MYILNVSYTKTIEEVQAQAPAHAAWVSKYIADQTFICAGPKKDKTGGTILVSSIAKDRLEAILNEDSYVQANVASYEILDFDCKVASKGSEQLVSA